MGEEQETEKPRKELQIGGQAVIEGVVMRVPERWALAIRRADGSIQVEVNPANTLAQRWPKWNVFLVRGIFTLIDSLIIGIKSISISAGIALSDEESPHPDLPPYGGKEKDEPQKSPGGFEVTVALVIAVVVFLGLFIVLPTVFAKMLDPYFHNTVVYNLFEAFLRIAIFVGYIIAVSFLPDVKRVFEYHGAEHKVVHAYEEGLEVTPGSSGRFSTAHVRCGTTFIVIVFIISILVFSLMGRPALWLRILERLAVIPLVAAVSFEIIKLAGRWEDSWAVRVLLAPGLWLQRITTREPAEDQLEVAIAALESAIGDGPVAGGA